MATISNPVNNIAHPPGSSGQVLTASVSNGTTYTTNWANASSNFNDGADAVMVIPHGSKTVEITKAATLDIKGDVR